MGKIAESGLRAAIPRVAAALLLGGLVVAAFADGPAAAMRPPAPLLANPAASKAPPPPQAPDQPVEGVLYSSDKRYAFPVAGAIADLIWTHYHWDGGNSVDIIPSSKLPVDSPTFMRVERSPIVAVTSGTVKPANNELGGTALILFGDDGREYYYAHLAHTWVRAPTRVRVGALLGTMGRTGRWTRFIERHLNFSITSRWHRGLVWTDDINAAEWIRREFGLRWIDQNPGPYPPAMPSGSPLLPPYRVVRSFAQMRAVEPDMASIVLAPVALLASGGGGSPQSGVYSTLTGEVRVMRATVLGLRVQVTNRPTKQTVVFSELTGSIVHTGDVVKRGELVGYATGPINYMIFDRGRLIDPLTTMGEAH